MKLIRIPALLLAAALQLMPMCRTVCTSPAFTSTLAIILRWTVGATATFGAFDAVSGGSQVYFDGPGTAVGTVGVPFTYYITVGGTISGDPGSIVAGAPLPAGFTNYTVSHKASGTPTTDFGVITGTPGSTMTNFLINLAASNPNYAPEGGVDGQPITGYLFLTVYPTSAPVVISSHPTNVTATNNQMVSFSVAASGTGPLTYQWFKSNTNIWYHIQSATNATYTFKASTNTAVGSFDVNAGNYLVRIAGAAGMVSSSNATLTVSSPAVAPTISTQPTNRTVTAGLATTFLVGAGGTAPLSYQWRLGGTALASATNSALNIASVQPTNAGAYTVIVTNVAGSITSAVATLTINGPPDITDQPQDQTVVAGQPANFSVTAIGAEPLRYQWLKDGTNFSDFATNSSWSLANARVADAGIYSVVVTNASGSINSSNAQLTVTIPSAPALSPPARAGNTFLFAFTPVVGLTNSVLTSDKVVGSGWSVFTNIPPPSTAASITVTDVISSSLKFYRVSIAP